MSSFLDKLQLSDQDERACLLGFLQRVHDGRRQHMVIKDVEYEAWRTFLDGAPREWYVEREVPTHGAPQDLLLPDRPEPAGSDDAGTVTGRP